VITLSNPPAAPRRWPVIDFVDAKAIFGAQLPKTDLTASVSIVSPTGVESRER